MSDSLTRLILRAQRRWMAGLAVAEPVLASLHEPDPGTGLGGAEPWVEQHVETEPAAPRATSPHPNAHAEPPRIVPSARPPEAPPWRTAPPRAPEPATPPPPLTDARDAMGDRPAAVPNATPAAIQRSETNKGTVNRLVAPAARPAGTPNSPPIVVRDTPNSANAPPRVRTVTVTPPPGRAPLLRPRAETIIERTPPATAISAPEPSMMRPPLAPPREAMDLPVTVDRDIRTATRDVRISIGHVELHATTPRAEPRQPAPARRPGTSLSEYLAQKSGRRP